MSGGSLEDESKKAMNTSPITLDFKKDRDDSLNVLKNNNIICAPVLNKAKHVVDLLFLDSYQNKKILNPVIIMAGGKGKRLYPITKKIPKPLIKMGNQTILEIIINNLKNSGFVNFYISVNYLKKKIIDYFGDGEKFNVNIKYLKERKYLGTAGALSLIRPKPDKPVLVLNGDIITNLDFKKFIEFHSKHDGIGTMAVREFITNLPYGVVDEKKGIIVDIKEKPRITNYINAGMYVLSPEFLDFISYNKHADMPDIFKKVIKKDRKTYLFSFYNSWFEVGRAEDLEKVQKIFNE